MTQELLEKFYSLTHTPIQTLDPYTGNVLKKGFGKLTCSTEPFGYYKLLTMNTTGRQQIEENLFVQVIEYTDKVFIIGPYTNCKENTDFDYKSETVENYLITILKELYQEMLETHHPYCFHIKRALDYLHNHFKENINLDELAEYVQLNKCYLCVLFKEETGLTFSKYLNKIRIDAAKRLLLETDKNITTISQEIGFNSQSYFIVVFREFMDMTPLEYRFRKRTEGF